MFYTPQQGGYLKKTVEGLFSKILLMIYILFFASIFLIVFSLSNSTLSLNYSLSAQQVLIALLLSAFFPLDLMHLLLINSILVVRHISYSFVIIFFFSRINVDGKVRTELRNLLNGWIFYEWFFSYRNLLRMGVLAGESNRDLF